MEEKHFKLIQFLKENGATKTDNFPQKLKTEFTPGNLKPGSLYYELDIIMRGQKEYIKKTSLSHFEITTFGADELQAEIT